MNYPKSQLRERINELGKPFVYYHTHEITRPILDQAKAAGKSLEVDMSVGEDGGIFIGHPLSFYQFKHIPKPNNLPLEDVLSEMKASSLYLVLDCKDVRALPKAWTTIQEFGAKNSMLHAWADALLFKPYPPEITIEPHWPYEDLPLDKILEVKAATSVPIVVSARGLTQERLQKERAAILGTITKTVAGKAEAINFNLPGGEAPPLEFIRELADMGVLTWFNIDNVPADKRPPVFIGASDDLDSVTDPAEFN